MLVWANALLVLYTFPTKDLEIYSFEEIMSIIEYVIQNRDMLYCEALEIEARELILTSENAFANTTPVKLVHNETENHESGIQLVEKKRKREPSVPESGDGFDNSSSHGDSMTTSACSLVRLIPSSFAIPGLSSDSFEFLALIASLGGHMYWDLSLPQLLKDDPASVASKLSRKSRCKFKCVPFEEFVRKAFGLSSQAIEHLLWQYQLLNVILYCMFTRNRQHKELLLQLKESLENGKADPFVCAATAAAWEKVSNAKNENLDLKLNTALDLALGLVLKPLQQTLKKPDSAQSVLQELEELNVLFCSHFYAPKVNWDVPFDNFIEGLKSIGVSALAETLSGEDRAFYKLNVQSSQKDLRVLHKINGRWNRLRCSVKECSDTGVVNRSNMYRFAWELQRRRNFYSFTAAISGMTQTTHEGAYLLDPAREYNLAAHLRYLCELYSVDDSTSSKDQKRSSGLVLKEDEVPVSTDDKMEYRSSTSANDLGDMGVMRGFMDLAGQISLGGCLFSCIGR